jgi:voltage-gated potassium channel
MLPQAADEPRVEAWNRRVDWPLTALAVVFLVAYAWSVLDRTITPGGRDVLEVLLTGTWVVFGLDYLVRIALARRRGRFVLRHLPDLAVLLLPMIRPLRVLRLVTVITVLHRRLHEDVRGKVLLYVAGSVTLVGFVAALAVLDAERDAPNASITTFGDALWWTVTTITTVGYGDRYPVTVEGRIVAGVLMVGGIALLGVVTASIASWFVETVRATGREVERDAERLAARSEAQLDAVLAELRALHARLDELEGSGTVAGTVGVTRQDVPRRAGGRVGS